VTGTLLGDLVHRTNFRQQVAEFLAPFHAKSVADFIGDGIFLFHACEVFPKDLGLAFADLPPVFDYKPLEMGHSVHGKQVL
jgi:hypothetical protein